MISGDLPLISGAAVASLTRLIGPEPLVAIVPDRRGTGTNALLCAPPEAIAPCFGIDSFQRHQAAARRHGIQPHIVESAELALDIDEPVDLHELRRWLDHHPVVLPAEMREALAGRALAPAP
jgi:2-phospho-L-lactate guanylyltransferase